MSERIELEFSRKYDRTHARRYFEKHQDGLWRKLSHHRDEQMARKALHMAGDHWTRSGSAVRCRSFLAITGRKAQPLDHRC